MSKADIATYRDLAAIGFASGFFFDADGRFGTSEFDECHITMPLEDLTKVPERICVGRGTEKLGPSSRCCWRT